MPIASATVPVDDLIATEFLTGKTVTSGATGTWGAGGPLTPANPTNSNDRNTATNSSRASIICTGTGPTYWWAVDLGSAQEVLNIHVTDVDLPTVAWRTPATASPAIVYIERSDNGTSWTAESVTYTTGTVGSNTDHIYTLAAPSTHRYWRIRKEIAVGIFRAADAMREWYINGFAIDPGSLVWVDAPDTIDVNDGTSDDVEASAITLAGGPFWRGVLNVPEAIADIGVVLGMENAGDVTVLLQGATLDDFSDAVTVAQFDYDATGSLTADGSTVLLDTADEYQYWQLVLDTTAQDIRVYEVSLAVGAAVPEPVGPSKAILEIYVHDEDASRWGVATWATGPATGTEGIWSAAGWQDVTPEGVNAHIIWGTRRPSRGILADQNAASWNVQTYDPDRILDPGNFDSPYYPQLVAGVPIRISHDSLVIRTGYVDEFHYRHKRPDYQGQLLCTDTWSLLNQAMVPADSILGNTLLARISDAIEAAGIAVGGIPLPPSSPTGPTIADWVEGADIDDATSVGEHVRIATSEVLWVAYIDAAAGLGLRPWGAPLDRGREITSANLEDLESVSHEDGLYSVVKVQPEDPDADPIIRKAAPLPRYGERVWERREPTVDPEGYADAILAERPWPGVQYIPGAIHCFSGADVDYFGSLEIMERVTVSYPGVVSVQGRILGGELFVEHRERDTKGAKWIFYFAIATDGSTAIGSTILVADGTGDTLVDDATGLDYLEED